MEQVAIVTVTFKVKQSDYIEPSDFPNFVEEVQKGNVSLALGELDEAYNSDDYKERITIYIEVVTQ